jgi:lauroyl/myristoyl acyltransferase
MDAAVFGEKIDLLRKERLSQTASFRKRSYEFCPYFGKSAAWMMAVGKLHKNTHTLTP